MFVCLTYINLSPLAAMAAIQVLFLLVFTALAHVIYSDTNSGDGNLNSNTLLILFLWLWFVKTNFSFHPSEFSVILFANHINGTYHWYKKLLALIYINMLFRKLWENFHQLLGFLQLILEHSNCIHRLGSKKYSIKSVVGTFSHFSFGCYSIVLVLSLKILQIYLKKKGCNKLHITFNFCFL